MRKREECYLCSIWNLLVIGRSASALSQILVNSKKSLITSLRSVGLRQISLILDKYIIGLRLVRLVIIVS